MILGGAIAGVIAGFQEDPFGWVTAVYWWASGLILGIVFIVWGRNLRLREIEKNTPPESNNTGIGNSKMSLDSKELQGYKMKSID